MIQMYEKAFNDKCDKMKDHPKYPVLDKSRKNALAHHTGCGFTQIVSADFMDRIIAMPESRIRDWLDGKDDLKWTPEDEARFNKLRANGYMED